MKRFYICKIDCFIFDTETDKFFTKKLGINIYTDIKIAEERFLMPFIRKSQEYHFFSLKNYFTLLTTLINQKNEE